MARFTPAYKITHGNEGGYANVEGDAGGETYRGIARNFHPDWNGWPIIDQVKQEKGPLPNGYVIEDASLDNLVKDFYKQNFWDPILGDRIRNQNVANLLYDFGVNSGTGTAVTKLQMAINETGHNIAVDGVMGPQTLSALNSSNSAVIHDRLKQLREEYVRDLVNQDPTQAKFLDGWLARIDSFPDLKKNG